MFGRACEHFSDWPLRARITGLFSDKRGVAALEFALIAPLLLSMYFVTMEVAQGIEANKKVGRVGSMVADLVTQQKDVTLLQLKAILSIGEATLQPYNRSKPTIIITAIQVTDEATPTVVWSRKLVDGDFDINEVAGTATTVPATLKIKGSFLIRVESKLDYKPVITWAAESKAPLGLTAAFDGISMAETYYLRPRMSNEIKCDDCNLKL